MGKEKWVHLKFSRGKESFVVKFLEPIDLPKVKETMREHDAIVYRISRAEYDRLIVDQEFKQNFSL